MSGFLDGSAAQLQELFGPSVLRILAAVGILVGGWLVALFAGVAARGALKKTTLDNRLAKLLLGEEKGKSFDIERWAGRVVYWVVLLFAVVGFFNALDLTVISEPLTTLLNRVFEYLPKVGGALLLLGAAWAVATISRRAVSAAMEVSRFDERLGGQAGLEGESRPALGSTVADAVYWLVFLLFLPAILDSLSLQGLLRPVQGLLDRILGFLPNVLAAGVILAVGWFVARVVQRILTNLLAAAGADALGDRLGMSAALGERRLSGLLGLIAYVLVLVPVLISSLNALQLEAVTRPASEMLARVLEAVPSIFAAGLLLALAYFAGRLIAGLVANLLAGAGFDGVLQKLGFAGAEAGSDRRTPSAVVGDLALVAIVLFATIEASRLLGFDSLAALLSSFVVFGGQVVLGLVVLGVGLYLANVAASAIQASGAAQAGLLAMAARVSIVVLAGAIGLRHMGLANEIIELAFGLLLGSVAVAAAIAFGLGGRDAAAKQIEAWREDLRSR